MAALTGTTGPARRFLRLVDPEALRVIVDAATRVAPGVAIDVIDAAGREMLRGPSDHGPGERAGTAVARPIELASEIIGTVLVHDANPGLTTKSTREAIADLLAASIGMTAREADARRVVTAAALDDLRELALVSRLAESVGTAVDPAAIAGIVLAAVTRPLRVDVGVVLGPGVETAGIVAAMGAAADAERLAADARPLLARLHAEDPVHGMSAERADGADSARGAPAGEAAAGAEPPRFASILAAALGTTAGTQGSMVLGRRPGRVAFDDTDRRLLVAAASQTAIAFERAALQHEIIGRRRVDDELAIGRRIQRSLMPRRFPELPGWDIAAAYEAAREVGGDLYDVFPLRTRTGLVAFTVADVTGKGIPAAILMADVRALIHAAADHTTDPADSLNRVNKVLVEERANPLFVTVAHGVIDTTTGELELASGGHDPVHVVRADGTLTTLEPAGRLIGMVADIGTETIRATIAPGDVLVAHTDGITEARSPEGGFYGEERFDELLASLAGRSAREIVDAVVGDVAAFRAGAEASDDLTLLVIRRQPPATDGPAD